MSYSATQMKTTAALFVDKLLSYSPGSKYKSPLIQEALEKAIKKAIENYPKRIIISSSEPAFKEFFAMLKRKSIFVSQEISFMLEPGRTLDCSEASLKKVIYNEHLQAQESASVKRLIGKFEEIQVKESEAGKTNPPLNKIPTLRFSARTNQSCGIEATSPTEPSARSKTKKGFYSA